jgi:hypothetical protein
MRPASRLEGALLAQLPALRGRTRRRRRAVMMLQHHTRNTEQKQWDETLTLALNGMNKVLRSHLPPFMGLPVSEWKAGRQAAKAA